MRLRGIPTDVPGSSFVGSPSGTVVGSAALPTSSLPRLKPTTSAIPRKDPAGVPSSSLSIPTLDEGGRTRTFFDYVDVEDSLSLVRDVTLPFVDLVPVEDSLTALLAAGVDPLSFAQADLLGVTDSLIKDAGRTLLDTVGVTDAFVKSVGKNATDSVGVTDSLAKASTRVLTDTVGLTDSASFGAFVTRDTDTGNLMLGGERFRFSGPNIVGFGCVDYASMYGATVTGGYHLPSHSEIDDLLDQCEDMNATVIRSYGSVMSVGRTLAVQPTLGSFNAAALEPVDYAIQQCAARGIKIYFPLVDAYDFQPRGAPWYCTVNGVTPDGNASQFYNLANTAIVNSFKAHISYVLDHVNTYTGVAYKDDPTILCWETGNELHATTWGDTQVAWTNEITRYIKEDKDAQQLIMDGCAMNGTAGDGGALQVDLPYVDISTFHAYFSGAMAQTANAAEVAHAHRKAWVCGEYTWTGLNPSGGATDFTAAQFCANVEASHFIDGDNYWQLLPTLVGVGGPSQFGLHYPGDDATMIARANTLKAHALAMQTAGAEPAPATFLTDNFTGTNGTALGSHTPDSGGTWSFMTGTSAVETIQSNRLYAASGAPSYRASATPATADYEVTLDVRVLSHVTSSEVWVIGRAASAAFTSYELSVRCVSSTSYTMSLKRWSAGSSTTLVNAAPISVAPGVGTSHTLTLRMRGNQISGYWDGKINLRINNIDVQAKGFAGLGQTAVSSSTGMHIDSIVATSPPAAEAILDEGFAPTANQTVALGDSITDSYSVGNYQPYLGGMYLNLLHVETRQRMQYGGIYATGGIPATKIRDIHLPEALAQDPGAAILYVGTNDTGNIDRTWNISYTAEVLQEMVLSLQDAGIAPILTTIGPHDEFTAYTANSLEWNRYVRALADQYDLPVIDIWAAVTDPDNTFKASYTPDGLHMNALSYEAVADRAIADGIPNIFPASDPHDFTARDHTDETNMLHNGTTNSGLFGVDSNSDGVANAFTKTGTGTFSLVAPAGGDDLVGYWQQLAHSTNGQTLEVQQSLSGWTAGDPIEFGCRVQTENITSSAIAWSVTVRCSVPGGFTFPDGSSSTVVEHGVMNWLFDANGLLYVEFDVPAGTTSMLLRATLNSRGSSGVNPKLRIGEATVRNPNYTPPPPPTPFVTDSMTGTNSTTLTSHTGELGATWTKHTGWTGNFAIQSNRIVGAASTEAHYYASGTPPSANYDVTTTIYAASNASFSMAGSMGRMVVGTNSAYAAFAIFDGSLAKVYLKRWVSGTGTDLAAGVTVTTPTVGSSHTLTLRMVGSSISALWDGAVVVGPITDSNIAAAGKAGVITNGIGSSTTGWHIDSINAEG